MYTHMSFQVGGVATHSLADRAAVQGDRQVSVHERGARQVDRDRLPR